MNPPLKVEGRSRCSYLTCPEPARVDYCDKHTLEVVAMLAQRILKQVYR